jgi:hypothetical protein
MGKRVLAEGVRGVFVLSLIQTSRWRKYTRILRVYVRILWTLLPDILDRDPEIPVLAETLSKYHFEVVLWLTSICMGSLEH